MSNFHPSFQTAFKLSCGIKTSMNDFAAWLQNELDIRGWRQADLLHKSEMNGGLLSQILNGHRRPGVSTCRAIARALDMREVDVLYQAGLIAFAPNEESSPMVQDLIAEFIRLDSSDQEQILKQIRALNIMQAKPSRETVRARR
jgi:transcriptional regulator with XRE-family HTH domain